MGRQNPYAISFGRIPHQYISRDVMISNITEALDSNFTDERALKTNHNLPGSRKDIRQPAPLQGIRRIAGMTHRVGYLQTTRQDRVGISGHLATFVYLYFATCIFMDVFLVFEHIFMDVYGHHGFYQ